MGNHNSGRRPAPTKIKLLKGVQRRDRLNLREPVTPSDPVVMPARLSSGAIVVWCLMAPICTVMGTLTVSDVPAFVRYCELQATFETIMSEKSAPGFRLLRWAEDATGERYLKVHPVARLEREYAAALKQYDEYFGLTPAARSRIYVRPAAAPAVSKWA